MPISEGISHVVVYNPSDGVAVQVTRLISNTFEFSKIDYESGETSATGGPLYKSDVSACSFSFLDPDGSIAAQLRAWKEARTRLSLVAIGPSVCVQWYEKDHISITPSALGGIMRGRGDKWDFEITRQGHGSHRIYKRANLLSHLGFADGNADELADSYISSGSPTLNFDDANLEQDVTSSTASAGYYVDIVMPLQAPGCTFTLSSEITTLHSELSSATMAIQALNFASSVISSQTNTVTATGRDSVSIASAANALYKLRIWPGRIPTGVTASGTVSSKEPALRLDGQTTYTQA